MPATVATSQLPKCPVSSSTPLPCVERIDERVEVLDAHQRALALRATASGSAGIRRRAATDARSAPARAARSRRPARASPKTRRRLSSDHARGETAAGDTAARPASGTSHARRAAPAPPPTRSRGRASATARCAAMRWRAEQRLARAGCRRPAARRSRRARPKNRRARSAPSAASRGNSLTHASFAAKRAARLAARPAPSPASASSCAEKILREVRGGVSREQPLDARDLDGIDAAARRRGDGGDGHRRAVSARERSARRWCRRSRGTEPARRRSRGACALGDTRKAGALGIELAQRRDARHDARARAPSSAITVSMMPAAAIRWPIAHLNAGHRRQSRRRTRGAAPRLPTRRTARVPLPCATIMPTSAGRASRRRSACADRARETVAVVADREQALSLRVA